MSGFTIVTLHASHIPELIDLWQDAGLPVRPAGRDTRGALAAQMALPSCRFLGARDEAGGLIGGVIANHEGRKGWINRLAVRPLHRNRGIGRALVAASEEWLFGQGLFIVAALVEGYNTVSQELFSACGYDRDDTLVYFRKVTGSDV